MICMSDAKTKVFVGIDPSFSACGITIIDTNSNVLGFEKLQFKPHARRYSEVFNTLQTLLAQLSNDLDVVAIAKEGYSYGTQAARNSQHKAIQTGELGSLVILAILEASAHFVVTKNFFIVPPTSWKKMILGQGHLKKDTSYVAIANKILKREFWTDAEIDSFCLALSAKFIYETKQNPQIIQSFERAKQEALVDAKALKESWGLTLSAALKQSNVAALGASLMSFGGDLDG